MAISPPVKWLEREAEHSHPSCAEIKIVWSAVCYTHGRVAWWLIKHTDSFNLCTGIKWGAVYGYLYRPMCVM